MQSVNAAICLKNATQMFVTVFIGVLDLQTGHLCYCNAGHEAPVILNPALATLPVQPHIPIGLFNNMQYGLQETDLPADSTIFLFTDGLTEAMDEEKQLFGIERVKTVLQRCAEQQQSPEEMISAVSKKVHHFVKEAEQSDDLTLVAIHYKPNAENK